MTYREPEKPDEYPVYLRGTRNELSRVEPGREHCVGRDARCDVVVFDMSIEWRHAMVIVDGAGLRVWALAGADGKPLATFVNDVQVGVDVASSAIARDGSKIRLGKATVAVQLGERVEREHERILANRLELRKVQTPRAMQGSLEEVPLVDLVALFETSKKNGVLVLRREDDVVARVHLKKGVIVHVGIDALEAIGKPTARAMMMELFGWQRAMFDLDPPSEDTPATVSLLGTELVLEYNAIQIRSKP